MSLSFLFFAEENEKMFMLIKIVENLIKVFNIARLSFISFTYIFETDNPTENEKNQKQNNK